VSVSDTRVTCAGRVRHDAWHDTSCSRAGTVEEDGKWWCKQHAPSTETRKKAEREERWAANYLARNQTITLAAKLRLAYALEPEDVQYSGQGQIIMISDSAAHRLLALAPEPPEVDEQ
jgi:hypothetical protein